MIKEIVLLKSAVKWIEQYGWHDFDPAFLAEIEYPAAKQPDGKSSNGKTSGENHSTTKYSLAEIWQHFDSKSQFLQKFIGFIDDSMLEQFSQNMVNLQEPCSEKELLWEILMIRFEIMNEYKTAIRKIWYESLSSLDVKTLWDHFWTSSDKKIIDTIRTTMAKNQCLSKKWEDFPVLLYTLRHYVFLTWIKEEEADLPQTMTVLDQALEKVLSF